MLDFLPEKNNVFLIDWLTFVTRIDDVDTVKRILGLAGADIPWENEVKFRNGYPLQCYWSGITISYGADQEEFYQDKTKARCDMGICVNLSGQGCRTYESYGANMWFSLFDLITKPGYNVTRLDLAYDDHIGILDIQQICDDTYDRRYGSKARYAEVIWSDNQDDDIQGRTVMVGSPASRILIRIYDKAAERGFKDRHWIRVELQIRKENAHAAVNELMQQHHIGRVSCGILRNYLTYRIPTADSNNRRWPIAPYWDRLLMDMERVRLWISPGVEYNIHKTLQWMAYQYGQAIVAAEKMGVLPQLLREIRKNHPDLAPKYRQAVEEHELAKAQAAELCKDESDDFDHESFVEWCQQNFFDNP